VLPRRRGRRASEIAGTTSDHASMFEAGHPESTMPVSLKLAYDATVDVAYLTLRPTGPP
jgi:hypothetical protein